MCSVKPMMELVYGNEASGMSAPNWRIAFPYILQKTMYRYNNGQWRNVDGWSLAIQEEIRALTTLPSQGTNDFWANSLKNHNPGQSSSSLSL